MSETFVFEGYAGPTLKVTTDNSADDLVNDASLPMLHATTGDLCRAVTITCETYDIRFTFGAVTPTIAGPVGHILAAGGSIRIANAKSIRSFQYINKTTNEFAVLYITPEYFKP